MRVNAIGQMKVQSRASPWHCDGDCIDSPENATELAVTAHSNSQWEKVQILKCKNKIDPLTL